MAELICTFKEFTLFVGPKIRNDVAAVTKQKKNKMGLNCQHCNKKVQELHAAHRHDSSRVSIIKSILEKCKAENEKYIIDDLEKIILEIKEIHKSDKVFYFLCEPCHKKYDSVNKTNNSKKETLNHIDGTRLKQEIIAEFQKNPNQIYTPRKMFSIVQKRDTKYYADTLWGLWKQGFLVHPERGNYQWNKDGIERETSQDIGISSNSLPNDVQDSLQSSSRQDEGNRSSHTSTASKRRIAGKNEGGITEILCENETSSWKYKLGWTSTNNRKNISELISEIESNFDCYPVATKSWYYYKRKDNKKQFCVILTNKNDSVICFRIEPKSFRIVDSRIIHNKRWFFSEGKEKRITIIPQNYDLILQCLSHAFEISK